MVCVWDFSVTHFVKITKEISLLYTRNNFSRFVLSKGRYKKWYKTPNDIYLFILVLVGTDGKGTATGKGKIKGDAAGVTIEVSEIGYVHYVV